MISTPDTRQPFFWGTAVLALAVVRSADVRRSIRDLLRILQKPSISVFMVGMLANATILTSFAVIAGREVGIWETLPVVTASIWSLITGFALLLNLGRLPKGENAFRSRVVTVLGPSTVVTEVVGVAILAFWRELVLVPVLVLLTLVVYTNRSTGLTNVSRGLLLAYVIGLISSVVVDLVGDPGTWRALAQAILLPIILTVGTLPYIQLLIVVERLRGCFQSTS